MPRSRVVRTRVLAVALAIVAAALLGGCSPGTTPGSTGGSPAAAPSAALVRMTPQAKRSELSTNFPIEVPVPAGKVTRAQAQGDEAWDYQLMLSAPMADVVAWYTTAYTQAEWQLAADSEVGDGRKLVFMKGNAGSEILVKPAGAQLTAVTGTLGVGTSVLNTQ